MVGREGGRGEKMKMMRKGDEWNSRQILRLFSLLLKCVAE